LRGGGGADDVPDDAVVGDLGGGCSIGTAAGGVLGIRTCWTCAGRTAPVEGAGDVAFAIPIKVEGDNMGRTLTQEE